MKLVAAGFPGSAFGAWAKLADVVSRQARRIRWNMVNVLIQRLASRERERPEVMLEKTPVAYAPGSLGH